MTIQAGDRMPAGTLKTMGEEGPRNIDSEELFAGKKAVLFTVPGAFTPGCSKAHLPGFVNKCDEIFAKGVDAIYCLGVNDAFVMDAWGKSQGADRITMLADGNAEYAQALGLDMDASGWGMGTRCKRAAMVIDDGVVTHLGIEPPGGKGVKESSAEAILDVL